MFQNEKDYCPVVWGEKKGGESVPPNTGKGNRPVAITDKKKILGKGKKKKGDNPLKTPGRISS